MHSPNTITQISTIDALLAGVYDGQMSCVRLMTYGNLGIGTFDHLRPPPFTTIANIGKAIVNRI